jgi:hypothetical protein
MSQQRITDALATSRSPVIRLSSGTTPTASSRFRSRISCPMAVELLYLDDLPALAIKLQLERAAPQASFLLYSAKPVP